MILGGLASEKQQQRNEQFVNRSADKEKGRMANHAPLSSFWFDRY